MKKISLYLMASLCACSAIVSCGDKDKKDSLIDYPYSTLTPEKQKEKLSDDAIEFLQALEGLQTNDAFKVLLAFAGSSNNGAAVMPEDESSLRANVVNVLLANYYGVWTFNPQTGEWTKTAATDRAEYNFYTEDDAPAQIVVKATASNLYYPVETGDPDVSLNYQLPKAISVKLYSNKKEVGSIAAETELTSLTSIPKLSKLSFSLGDYSFSASLKKANPNVLTAALKSGKKSLISLNCELTADLDQALEEDSEVIPEKVNITYTLLDKLAFVGTSDITKAMTEIAAINEKAEKQELTAEQALAATNKVYADNVKVALVSLTDKTKIASLKVLSYYTELGSLDTKFWLVFNDQTEVEAAVYFSEGFDQVTAALNALMASFIPQTEETE